MPINQHGGKQAVKYVQMKSTQQYHYKHSKISITKITEPVKLVYSDREIDQ